MTDTTTEHDPTRVEVTTPYATFTLALSSGNHSSTHDTSETAARWGLPANLAAITDVAIHPAVVQHEGGGQSRPVVVNGVEYTGSGYLIGRGYYIGSQSGFGETGLYGDNGWSVDGSHYWTWQHCTRYTESRGYQPVSEAASRKLSQELDGAARALLADVDAVRAYWQGRFMSARGYKLTDAQRSINDANRYAALARDLGATVADVDRVAPTDY